MLMLLSTAAVRELFGSLPSELAACAAPGHGLLVEPVESSKTLLLLADVAVEK